MLCPDILYYMRHTTFEVQQFLKCDRTFVQGIHGSKYHNFQKSGHSICVSYGIESYNLTLKSIYNYIIIY